MTITLCNKNVFASRNQTSRTSKNEITGRAVGALLLTEKYPVFVFVKKQEIRSGSEMCLFKPALNQYGNETIAVSTQHILFRMLVKCQKMSVGYSDHRH